MPSDLPRLTVRMEKELIDKVNILAKKESRSTNQQIVYILKKYVEQYENLYGEIKIEKQEEEELSKNIKIKNSKNFIVGDNSTINM